MDDFIMIVCKQFKIKVTKSILSQSKVYMQSGVELFKDDLIMLNSGDTVYFDPNGDPYKTAHILDQYQTLEMIGEGGFGSVYRAKHIETGEEVAIKYIDISEQLTKASSI